MRNKFNSTEVGPRIKSLRKQRKLSMRQFASKSGVSLSFLSRVESGKASPTILTLLKILDALEEDVAGFFSANSVQFSPHQVIYKNSDMKLLEGNDRNFLYAFPSFVEIGTILTYEEFQPQSTLTEVIHLSTDACGFVLSGELSLEIKDVGKFVAKKGDAFYIQAGMEHLPSNKKNQVCKIVCVQLKK